MKPFKLLIVTYIFPPSGGAGVQRVAKFCKYLPENNVSVTVLTASNPSIPVFDDSQTGDIPDEIKIIKVPTLEPSYKTKRSIVNVKEGSKGNSLNVKGKLLSFAKKLIFPDPQLLWLPCMFPALIAQLIKNPQDGVFISGPPFSPFLTVPLIRFFLKGKIIIDYRDEWETVASKYEQSCGSPKIRRFCEKIILKRSDSIIVTTPAFKERLLEQHPFLEADRVHIIQNGFDQDDYGKLPEDISAKDKFTIKYAGTLFNLESPEPFVNAVKCMMRKHSEISNRLQITFIGRIADDKFVKMITSLEKNATIEIKGYIPHNEAVHELNQSNLNLIFLSEDKDAGRMYPAKVFELMAIGRNILTIAPKGVLSDLVVEEKLGEVFRPNDVENIADYIFEQFQQWEANPEAFNKRKHTPNTSYSRKELTKKLVQILKQ